MSAATTHLPLTPTCQTCQDGFVDILRPCPDCKRSTLEKRNARAAAGDADTWADPVLFCRPVTP